MYILKSFNLSKAVKKSSKTLFFLFCCLFMTISHSAHAKAPQNDENIYVIKRGDFLGQIAIEKGISVAELMELNNLENPDKIFFGMKLRLPDKKAQRTRAGVTIEIPRGITLSRIAQIYEVSVYDIVKANKSLQNPDSIRFGQKILIPGVREIKELIPPPPCFNPEVEFYRVRNGESQMIHLTFCNGKTNPEGVELLSQFSAPVGLKEAPFPLHSRIALLLQRVANKYPGRRIEIISAQRETQVSGNEGYHSQGKAIDFRVQGVSNKALSNFVRTFNNVGVGYYPNSVFIHMDTRDTNAFWVDYSAPGERPIYARAGLSSKEVEAIRAKRSNINKQAEPEEAENKKQDQEVASSTNDSKPVESAKENIKKQIEQAVLDFERTTGPLQKDKDIAQASTQGSV